MEMKRSEPKKVLWPRPCLTSAMHKMTIGTLDDVTDEELDGLFDMQKEFFCKC